ncbi:MAG: hypothetical protein E6Q29_14430 [Alicycliphilus sp.]|nr:MAG: hypothetical protein E6Q29_14430 [Alicycliphilus sp.]
MRKFGFVAGEDFLSIFRSPELASGNRGAPIDYHLTLDMTKFGRWLLAFTDANAPAYVQPMEHGAFVATRPRLVKDVASGECMCTNAELLDMAVACMQRLQQRGPARQALPA